MSKDADFILPLLQAVTEAAGRPTLNDLDVVEAELRTLFQARHLILRWIEKLSEKGEEKHGVSPTQFLRAWNDSTTRVIQLLRARRDLGGKGEGESGPLMDGVYGALQELLPGLEESNGK